MSPNLVLVYDVILCFSWCPHYFHLCLVSCLVCCHVCFLLANYLRVFKPCILCSASLSLRCAFPVSVTLDTSVFAFSVVENFVDYSVDCLDFLPFGLPKFLINISLRRGTLDSLLNWLYFNFLDLLCFWTFGIKLLNLNCRCVPHLSPFLSAPWSRGLSQALTWETGVRFPAVTEFAHDL